jgi:hypothetical protein
VAYVNDNTFGNDNGTMIDDGEVREMQTMVGDIKVVQA